MFMTYLSYAEKYDTRIGGLGLMTWESLDRQRKKERGRVRDILFSTAIEKKINHLRCLESPSAVNEIWEALDQTCRTKEQVGLDDVSESPTPVQRYPRRSHHTCAVL